MAKQVNQGTEGITEKNAGIPSLSKIDQFSGRYTPSLIVGTLFTVVIICFIIFIISIKSLDQQIIILITSGFFSLLSLLAGFFVGTKLKNE
jgi:hypothetical protein